MISGGQQYVVVMTGMDYFWVSLSLVKIEDLRILANALYHERPLRSKIPVYRLFRTPDRFPPGVKISKSDQINEKSQHLLQSAESYEAIVRLLNNTSKLPKDLTSHVEEYKSLIL
ncbi:hypothetical protein HDU97_000221 [Phlyctochytrium planicorne]|nr:hypothetical protein HDU97_000221 [Phlyctochytrium planicorne]